jgi:hypothetical protein
MPNIFTIILIQKQKPENPLCFEKNLIFIESH